MMKASACCALLLTLASTAALQAGLVTLDHSYRSRIRESGYRQHSTHTGTGQFNDSSPPYTAVYSRSYYVFDLTGINAPVSDPVLRLELTDFVSPLPAMPQNLTLFDVTSPEDWFTTAFPAGNTDGQAFYDDLGTGTSYGTVSVVQTDVGNMIEIPLNAQAVADMNAAVGGVFAIGLAHDGFLSTTASEFLIFGEGGETRTHQLVFNQAEPPVSTPEPATCVLLLGLGTALFALRRRRSRR